MLHNIATIIIYIFHVLNTTIIIFQFTYMQLYTGGSERGSGGWG